MRDRDDTQRPRLVIAGGDTPSDAQIANLAGWLLDLLEAVEGVNANATPELQAAPDRPGSHVPAICGEGSPGLGLGVAKASSIQGTENTSLRIASVCRGSGADTDRD